MDEQLVIALRDRALRLREELAALCEEADEIPAVARNAARMRASLAMICLSLGQDAQGEDVI